MKPLIIRSRLIPPYICVNLFGTFWTRDKSWIDKYVINHERIHTRQQMELLYIPFYLVYLIEWVIRFIQYKEWKTAYMNISFEKEAYKYGHDLTYLKKRKWFAWTKFLK